MKKNELKEWNINCEFIEEEMQFYSMRDFYLNARWIKRLYENLSSTGKKLYQYYIFSKRYLKNAEVIEIWDILNDFIEIPELTEINII